MHIFNINDFSPAEAWSESDVIVSPDLWRAINVALHSYCLRLVRDGNQEGLGSVLDIIDGIYQETGYRYLG